MAKKIFRFRSIRGKFVLYFIIGLCVTLLISSFLSYRLMYNVVFDSNQQTSSAEFAQIESNLVDLHDSINQQITSIMGSDYLRILQNKENQTLLEITYALQDFDAAARALLYYFPYVNSVLLLYDDGNYALTTNNSFQNTLLNGMTQEFSQQLLGVMELAGKQTSIIGDLSAEDFPIPQSYEYYWISHDNEPFITLVRRSGNCVMAVNVYESHVESMYSGIAENMEYSIRLLNGSGTIISAPEKDEIGTFYQKYEEMLQTPDPGISPNSHQLIFHTVSDLDLIITNEIQLDTYLNSISNVRNLVVFIFLLGLIITCAAFLLWMNGVFSPLKRLEESMSYAGKGIYHKLERPDHGDEISNLIVCYNRMLNQLESLEQANRVAEDARIRSELKALRSQINPHFLNNTLNVLKWMALQKGESDIAEGLSSLGTIMAPLYKADSPDYPLREEMKMLEKYISIMNLRFGGTVTLEFDVPVALENMLLPRFCLQPIVENAVIHGFATLDYCGEIHIFAEITEEGDLSLEVQDTGVGLSADKIEQLNRSLLQMQRTDGFGLYNSMSRIQLRYGNPYGLRLREGDMQGLCVEVLLPAIERNR